MINQDKNDRNYMHFERQLVTYVTKQALHKIKIVNY